eukprot:7291938-Pyramimonas_sp.AAC.1
MPEHSSGITREESRGNFKGTLEEPRRSLQGASKAVGLVPFGWDRYRNACNPSYMAVVCPIWGRRPLPRESRGRDLPRGGSP